jgi:phospholipid transport system substrate-binding protein
MRVSFVSLLQRLVFTGLVALGLSAGAQAKPDPNGSPDQFVLAAANEALDVLKADGAVKAGNTARINQVVNEHILPYVNFQKTTRLAAGRYWRQANDVQKKELA